MTPTQPTPTPFTVDVILMNGREYIEYTPEIAQILFGQRQNPSPPVK